MKNVVFATDFLESSRLALDYAVAFAHHYSAKLTIVHAFELPQEADEAEWLSQQPSLSRERALMRLESFAAGIKRQGVMVQTDLRDDDPYTAILASAAENHADILMLGTHGTYRGLSHMLLGSNAEKILLSSPCPTLTVGRHVMAGIDMELKFNEITLICDFSPESVYAARYAAALGRNLDVPTSVVSVVEEGKKTDDVAILGKIEGFCNELARVPGITEERWFDPAYYRERAISPEQLLHLSRNCSEGVFVLGVHEETRLNRHLHTSFAYELITKASCPLLSIRR